MKKVLLLLVYIFLSIQGFAFDIEQNGVYYNIISSQEPLKVEVTSGPIPYSGNIDIGKQLINDGKTYTITRIGNNAFAGCSSLTSITLAEGLESLGVGSFSGCVALSAISIPSTVTSIEARSFSACSQLGSISLPSALISLGDYCFSGCIALSSISIPSQVIQLGDYCFSGCTKITILSLPSSVTHIGQYCFNECVALESLQLSSNLISLPSFFISGCKQLKNIAIPSSVETLTESCFGNCFLESLTIPNSVTNVNGRFLDKNPNIKSVVYNANATYIPTYYESNQRINVGCFNECLALENIEIKSPITMLPAYCFKECLKLKKLSVPNNITAIGECCFVDCYELIDFAIPESVRTIGGACFFYCKSLKSISIPYGVTELPAVGVYYYDFNYRGYGYKQSCGGSGGCFFGCESLESITIPSSIVSMGYGSFSGCSSLKSVSLPSTITSLDRRFFYGCKSLSSVNIPSSVTSIGDECFCGCESLSEIIIPSSVTSLGEGCFRGSQISTITIPSTITELKKYTFGSCSKLKSILIPSSITKIEEGCFSGCSSLDGISIPKSVSFIGGACFAMCTSLKNIELPESITELMDGSYSSGATSTTWSTGFFGGCTSLTEVELPSSIKKIGNGCFNNCSNLAKLTINAESVPETGYSVFEGSLYKSIGCLYVPASGAALYKTAEQWKDWKHITAIGGGEVEIKQCETPTISYSDGQLLFSSMTKNAKFHYLVEDSDITTDSRISYGAINLSATYKITVYASAEGYSNSDKTTATLSWNGISPIMTGETAKYRLTFIVDNKELSVQNIAYGSQITAPTTDSEGNTVTWYTYPATMPAHDLVVYGMVPKATAPTKYTITYVVDGQTYRSVTVDEGATVSKEKAPYKEGYTFNGWQNEPSTMPANNVTVNGSFSVNSYRLSFIIDNQQLSTRNIAYGATITAPTKDSEGNTITWYTYPTTMPAHDLVVYGMSVKEQEPEVFAWLTVNDSRSGYTKIKVKQGAEQTLNFTAEEGWKISNIFMDGRYVTSRLAEDGTFVTPVITGDTSIIIVYEEEAPSDARAATRSQDDIKVVSDGIIISNTEPQSRCIIYSSDGQQVVNTVINDGTRKIALQQGQVYILTINGRTLKFAL